jgi:hypothetical protein
VQDKLSNHCHSRCFCKNACGNDSGCTYILALATLIDATQSGLYLCHVAQGMQGKLSKHCHFPVFADMPATIIVATLNIRALATLIDAAILGLALFVLHWPRYARQVQ